MAGTIAATDRPVERPGVVPRPGDAGGNGGGIGREAEILPEEERSAVADHGERLGGRAETTAEARSGGTRRRGEGVCPPSGGAAAAAAVEGVKAGAPGAAPPAASPGAGVPGKGALGAPASGSVPGATPVVPGNWPGGMGRRWLGRLEAEKTGRGSRLRAGLDADPPQQSSPPGGLPPLPGVAETGDRLSSHAGGRETRRLSRCQDLVPLGLARLTDPG